MNTKEELKLSNDNTAIIDFEDEFFNDWYKVLYQRNKKEEVEFANPILNQIFNS